LETGLEPLFKIGRFPFIPSQKRFELFHFFHFHYQINWVLGGFKEFWETRVLGIPFLISQLILITGKELEGFNFPFKPI